MEASKLTPRDLYVEAGQRQLDYHPLMQEVAILPMAEQPGVILNEAGIIQQLMQPITDIGVKKIKTKLQAYHQFNRHNIESISAYSNSLSEQRLNANATGLGTVIQFGKVSLDLGLVYDHLKYDAYLGENEIHKIQAPVHLRYALYQQDDLQVYVKGGISYNGVLDAHYEESPTFSQATNTSQKDYFHDGLLNKGYRELNTYLTYNAGIGVEVPIWNNFSLYSEALLQMHDGKTKLGYSADAISSKSLNIGVSYTFNR